MTLSKLEVSQIIKEVNEGDYISHIARRHNIARKTVYNVMRKKANKRFFSWLRGK
jgi:hypothetical protein